MPVRTTQGALGLALYSPKLPVVVGVGRPSLIAHRLEISFKVLWRAGFPRCWSADWKLASADNDRTDPWRQSAPRSLCNRQRLT